MTDERLDVFLELNSASKKVPWQQRVRLVNEVFPSYTRLEWMKAFNDISLFGRLLRDILKTDQTQPGRSGPRPDLERGPALARLRQYMGSDYSELPFPTALRDLSNGASIRGIGAKTGIEATMIHRLLAGTRAVDMVTIEQVAKAYKKEPGYFLEYRLAYVLAALGDRMVGLPETTVDIYRKIKGQKSAA